MAVAVEESELFTSPHCAGGVAVGIEGVFAAEQKLSLIAAIHRRARSDIRSTD